MGSTPWVLAALVPLGLLIVKTLTNVLYNAHFPKCDVYEILIYMQVVNIQYRTLNVEHVFET